MNTITFLDGDGNVIGEADTGTCYCVPEGTDRMILSVDGVEIAIVDKMPSWRVWHKDAVADDYPQWHKNAHDALRDVSARTAWDW